MTKRLGRLLAALASVMLTASGCSSSGPGDQNGLPRRPSSSAEGYDGPTLAQTPGPLLLDELGDAYETVLCEALIQCEGRAYRDVEHCRGDLEADGLQDVLDSVDEGRVSYDPELMGQCRRTFEANLCLVSSFFFFVPDVPDIVELCAGTIGVGTQTEGQPCRGDIECDRDFYCDDEASCPGVCRARKPPGQSCTSQSECEPAAELPELTLAELLAGGEDLIRESTQLTADCHRDTCRYPSAAGDACLELQPDGCAGNVTFCDVATGQCEARGGDGDACMQDGDQCAEGHWCDIAADATTGTCRADGDAGEPCESVAHCQGELRCLGRDDAGRGRCSVPSGIDGPCESESDCEHALGCDDGRCTSLPQAGSPCLANDCAPDAVCVDDICRPVSYPGEPCDDVEQPCLGLCRNGMCEARLPLGASCADGDQCQSRACEGGTCIDDELCGSQ